MIGPPMDHLPGVPGPHPRHAVASEEEDAPLIMPQNQSQGRPWARERHLGRIVSKATLLMESDVGVDGPSSGVGHALLKGGFLHESMRLAELAVPLVVSSMSSFLISMIGVAFVGHLGKWELSVVVLASSLLNVSGLSFLIGSLGALETVAGQAFGARDYVVVGVALQRAMLFTLALAGIVAVAWTKIEGLMLLLGQQPTLAAAAAQYLRWNTPVLFSVGASDCLKRYLTAQNVVAPTTVASLLAVLVAPLFNWLFVFKAHWGLFGAAVAGNLAQATPLVVMLVWTVWRERSLALANSPVRTWHGFSWNALRGWGTYAKLAAPSAAMVCLEWWTFEACVIFAGWLIDPELEVAVMGLTLNVSGLLYMMPLGLGAATSVRVSNSLGAGLPNAAARSAHVAIIIAAALQCSLALLTLTSRHYVAYMFTSDNDVGSAAATVFPVMAWCLLGDGINATIGGVLRGSGRQELGAALNLVAYWVVGLPLAWTLAFKAGWGVPGLWTGLATCASINGVAMLTVLFRIDWFSEAQRATEGDVEGCKIEGSPVRSSSDVEFAQLPVGGDNG